MGGGVAGVSDEEEAGGAAAVGALGEEAGNPVVLRAVASAAVVEAEGGPPERASYCCGIVNCRYWFRGIAQDGCSTRHSLELDSLLGYTSFAKRHGAVQSQS